MIANFPEQKVNEVPTEKWNHGINPKNFKYALYNIEKQH